MGIEEEHHLSEILCRILHNTGTNDSIKGIRKEIIQLLEKKQTELTNGNCGVLITGSTAEGSFPLLKSDLDIMFYFNDLICVLNSNGDTYINSVVPDYSNAPPGYARLYIDHLDFIEDRTAAGSSCDSSMTSTKRRYISSTAFRKNVEDLCKGGALLFEQFNPLAQSVNETNGPARSGVHRIGQKIFGRDVGVYTAETDIVVALLFYDSSFLRDWSLRPRMYDWPSQSLLEDVAAMEGFLVPIGEKDSDYHDVEWRISFVTAEKLLLANLNPTQTKLFAVFKMIAKANLTTISKNFSSYIVKNIILWVVERNPTYRFQPHLLLDGIRQCLSFAKLCLQNNNLPTYILPSRNLLAGRIFGKEKHLLIDKITCLLNEGAGVVLRIPILAKNLHSALVKPRLFDLYGTWRNEVETILLVDVIAMMKHLNRDVFLTPNGIFEWYLKYYQEPGSVELQFKIADLVIPSWREKPFDMYGNLDLMNARILAVMTGEMIP